MARIRSVHPGLFTDEAFAQLSADAALLLIGIWTESDDQGIFEWKPTTLRMRLRPAKDGDVAILLEEILSVDCIRKFEVDGKFYGAVRNFRKWQRPEKPTNRHPLPDSIAQYVFLSPSNRQPIEDDSANGSRITPQRKEEGGRRKDGGDKMKEEAAHAAELPLEIPFSTGLPHSFTPEPEKPAKKRRGGGEEVVWTGAAYQITSEIAARWSTEYPGLDFYASLTDAARWRVENPRKAPKTDTLRHLQTWLSRDFESGKNKRPPGLPGNSVPAVPDAGPDGWEDAYRSIYDCDPLGVWPQMIPDVQSEILSHLAA